MKADLAMPSDVSAEQVQDFLKKNPDFLKKNPSLMEVLAPPERELGDGVVDFQHFMVKNLQKDTQALKSRYDVLIDYCRDNMSAQSQVHGAVLRLVRARNLEQLLEVITLDLVSLFDVDVVRLAMESDATEFYETYYSEQSYSGIVFIGPGAVDATLGKHKNVLLVEDATLAPPYAFSEIFADCSGQVLSCALLRLGLEEVRRNVMLAFGVRHRERFHAGQGVELLHFLAQIVAHQLDMYLSDLSI